MGRATRRSTALMTCAEMRKSEACKRSNIVRAEPVNCLDFAKQRLQPRQTVHPRQSDQRAGICQDDAASHSSSVSMSRSASLASSRTTGIPRRDRCDTNSLTVISASLAERASDKCPSRNRAVAKAGFTPAADNNPTDSTPAITASGRSLFITTTTSRCALRRASVGLFFRPLTLTVSIPISYRNIS